MEKVIGTMEHFVEIIAESLFGLAKETPDTMPEDISYNSDFIVRHPAKKTLARTVASLIVAGVFSLACLLMDIDTRILYVLFTVLFGSVFFLSLIALSFRCFVSERCINKSYWGLLSKRIEWHQVSCVRVVEKTDEKSVVIAIYNEDGKCVIDLNTDMDNAWYVVKMAEVKGVTIKQEKDLSIKQISRL